MPELPEVDHVVGLLNRTVVGKKIADVTLLRHDLMKNLSPRAVAGRLRGCIIEQTERRGKFILIHLSRGWTLLVHLRMTGGFAYGQLHSPLPRYTRAIFTFTDGSRLLYEDRRNLGVIYLVRTEGLSRLKELNKLGPEPLGADFTLSAFRDALGMSRRTIKEILLDQRVVVGLGNIYAAEALHRAGIRPTRKAYEVARSLHRVKALYQAIRETLQRAISARTETALHFTFLDAPPRASREIIEECFLVYGREGEPCMRCGARIRRLRQGGRSTYYCPRCQR
ncbi:MAG TPA: bifunctional DNA-formamidopyrimidine glycosylase/DNA-(apurinic or apyrimidinic site) lyase [Blastocatellia bacterium]|nr:bifunctional DNA-formamidopyrimidine glycosylase/DNA-(apurinic or apyrimidinic site) lyase [Blastocatellia bacterium]